MNSSIYEIAVFPLIMSRSQPFVSFHAVSPYHRIISEKRGDTATQLHSVISKMHMEKIVYYLLYYIYYIII